MHQARLILVLVVVCAGGGLVDVVVEEERDVQRDGGEDGGLPERRPPPVLPRGEHLAARFGPEHGAAAVGRRRVLPVVRRREEARGRHHAAGTLKLALHRRAKTECRHAGVGREREREGAKLFCRVRELDPEPGVPCFLGRKKEAEEKKRAFLQRK
uniref:Uncharacterized protein n=1 Tax=Arundo donax TaxID=35708 RepID=A0A0A9DC80_ARUDO